MGANFRKTANVADLFSATLTKHSIHYSVAMVENEKAILRGKLPSSPLGIQIVGGRFAHGVKKVSARLD